MKLKNVIFLNRIKITIAALHNLKMRENERLVTYLNFTIDYGFKPTMHCDKKIGVYLSKALAESLSVADLRKAFSEHASISSKHLKKQDIIDRLE